jgi:uncharacterized membrane protein YfcA
LPDLSFDLLLVLVAAFAAGLIDAMVGGGGLIQIPALFAVYPGVEPATLLGTSKFGGIFGTISAVVGDSREWWHRKSFARSFRSCCSRF